MQKNKRKEALQLIKLKSENLLTEWCKGCGYCVKWCPKEALSIGKDLNHSGYRYVLLDEEKCVACGICRTVCPDCVFRFTEEVEA